MSVWFVTGASRLRGRDRARSAVPGHRVAATARDVEAVRRVFPKSSDSLLVTPVDVTDERTIRRAVDSCVARFDGIDVLVNNAGRGLLAAAEEASDAAARAVLDTNVFGLLATQRAALPVLRAQRSSHVINISSVGGFTTAPGWGLYATTKFAVEGLSEALHAELTPLGINVTSVEPGGFRTDFLDGSSLHVETNVIADYQAAAGATRSGASSSGGVLSPRRQTTPITPTARTSGPQRGPVA